VNNDQNTQNALSVSVAKFILIGFTSIFACVSILTYAAQIFKLSFVSYAYLSAISSVCLLLLGIFYVVKTWKRQAYIIDTGNLLRMGAISLASAFATIFIINPDRDDFYYVPNAIFHLAHPAMQMDWTIHYLYTNGSPLYSFFWATSTPYEYIQAVISYFTGIQYLFIYYVIAAALIGVLISLSYFYVLYHFTEKTLYAVLGTAVIVGSMLFLVETHRTIGSMSYVRAFQGKVLFLAAGIPLFIGFTRKHFKKPTLASAILLLAVNIALIGASSTAIMFLPFLGLLLATAEYFTKENNRKHALASVLYFSSMIYNAGFALATLNYSQTYLSASSPINQGWPTTFLGQVQLLINPAVPMTPVLLVASSLLALILLPANLRKYLAVWILASFVLYLNPISADFLIKHITTPNIYWRMFYLLPFPLTMGLAATALLARLNLQFNLKQWAAVGSILIVGLTLPHFLFYNASAFNNRLGLFQDKLNPINLASAQQIATIAPPGVMLSPKDFSGTMLMVSANYPQIRVREDAEHVWLDIKDANLRINASDFCGGDDAQINAFKAVLLKYPAIESIVMKLSTWQKFRTTLSALVESQGFTTHVIVHNYYIVIWK